MKAIWHIRIHEGPIDVIALQIPQDAKILDVIMRKDHPYVVAMVEIDKPKVTTLFEAFELGETIPEVSKYERDYIGTFYYHLSDQIYHLFKLKEL